MGNFVVPENQERHRPREVGGLWGSLGVLRLEGSRTLRRAEVWVK